MVWLFLFHYTLFFYKNKVYKNAEAQVWWNFKNILRLKITKFFTCSYFIYSEADLNSMFLKFLRNVNISQKHTFCLCTYVSIAKSHTKRSIFIQFKTIYCIIKKRILCTTYVTNF